LLHEGSLNIELFTPAKMGHAVAQWLRHCATNRKVAGSIPDGVIETRIMKQEIIEK
jgi:hypothetical protein